MRRLALWLSWLLIFVVPFENLFERGVFGTLGRVTGFAVAGAWLLSALVAGRVREPRVIHGLMIGFALWCAVSVLWSLDPEASGWQALTFAQLVLLTLIVWDLYDEPIHLHRALQVYVLGCWVSVATALRVFLSGEAQRRLTVGVFNENTLGFVVALALPMAWYLATAGRSQDGALGRRGAMLLRLSNLAFLPAATFAILLTGSRAAMLGAVICFAYMALSLGRLRPTARVAVFVVAAACAMYGVALVPETSLERLEGTSAEVREGDWNGRLRIWNEALHMISERPVAGVGVAAFARGAVETGAAPHNFVLSILAELGLIGFALFSGVLVGSALIALRQPPALAVFWLSMLAAWFLNAITHVYEDKKITWLLFGLIVVSDGLRQVAPAKQRAAAALHPAAARARS